MKKLDYETEKQLGSQLDFEYALGFELIDDIIPYATEYFVGVIHDGEEFTDYLMEQSTKSYKDKKKSS